MASRSAEKKSHPAGESAIYKTMHDLSRLPKIRSNERPAPGEFIIALSILLYIPFFSPLLVIYIYIAEKKRGEEYERQAGVVNL